MCELLFSEKLCDYSSREKVQDAKEDQESTTQNLFLTDIQTTARSFNEARNYFKSLEQNLQINRDYNSLDSCFRKNKCGSLKQASDSLYANDFVYDDIIGSNRKCPNRVCMQSFVLHLKCRKKTRRMLISLFDFDVKR